MTEADKALQAYWRDRQAGPFDLLLGQEPVSRETGHAISQLEVAERHHNPHGGVHGGVIATLVDSTMGMAAGSVLDDSETVAPLELKTNYLRPVSGGVLRAEAKVISQGRRTIVTTCDVTLNDASNHDTSVSARLIAHASATWMRIERPGPT